MSSDKILQKIEQLITAFPKTIANNYFEALKKFRDEDDVNPRKQYLTNFFKVKNTKDLFCFSTKYPMFGEDKLYNVKLWLNEFQENFDCLDVKVFYGGEFEGELEEVRVETAPEEYEECNSFCSYFFEKKEKNKNRFMVEFDSLTLPSGGYITVKIFSNKDNREFLMEEVFPSIDKSMKLNIFKNKMVVFGDGINLVKPKPIDFYIMPESLDCVVETADSIVFKLNELKENKLKTKAGFLFFGPPGTGKSSFLHFLFNRYYGNATIILLTAKSFSAAGLLNAYSMARSLAPSIVAFEDFDLIAKNRETGVFMPIMNELLNILDGHEDNYGVITLATTNYLSEIDGALTSRPGRIDKKIKIDYPSVDQKVKLFVEYFKDDCDLSSDELKIIFDSLSDNITNDYLKEILLKTRMLAYNDSKSVSIDYIKKAIAVLELPSKSANITIGYLS